MKLPKSWKRIKKEEPIKEVKKKELPKETIGELLRVQDVMGFFKYNINPSFIEAKIEKEISSQMRGARTIPFMWITVIAILLIAGGVAYTMFANSSNNTQCLNDLKVCYQTCAPAAKAIIQSGTQAATIT